MQRSSLFLLGALLGLVSHARKLPEKVDYSDHIRPILSDRCFFCHGPDENDRKSGLRLDTREGALEGLGRKKDRFAIVPEKPDESLILERIHSTDPDEQMPPPERGLTVTDYERALLRRWIEQGAEYEGHWAFEKLAKPDVPKPEDPSQWARNEIDQFVLAGLAEKKVQPRPEVSPEKLLRRLSFDLTGLPPTLAELDADEPISNAVERLLSSPRYGERMAVDWLDASRYADTYGFQVDRDRQVWPWRDWVVRAFNDNLPYDQFATWQIAGDLLPDATDDQILATAFSRLHQQKVEGGTVPEEFRVEYVADRVHTFGTTFLGLTLECARCHDHKYDPITAANYYEFFAFFQNIDEAGLYSYFTGSTPTPTLDLTNDGQKEELKKRAAKVAELEKALAELPANRREAFAAWQKDEANKLPEHPGLIAHHTFDEKVAGGYTNLAGGAVIKTSGANIEVDGAEGKALQLTGDDGVGLHVGDFRRYQPFSVAADIWPAEQYERAVVWKRSKAWTDAASRGYELLLEDGRPSAALIHFYPGNAIRVRAVEKLPAKTWSEVTLTWDGSSRAAGLKLYVNGKPAKTEIIYDNLTREIVGGGDPNIVIGQRFRDKGFKNGRIDNFRVYNRELTAGEVAEKPDPFEVWFAAVDEEAKTARAELEKARKHHNDLRHGFKEIMVMREVDPKPAFILERGLYDQRGAPVEMATPSFLPPMPEDAPVNRLGLAKWLTTADHPLTARVFVNRIWQMYFGEGLVRTPEDFGSQGALPTHPELLDWLSATFVEDGWDIKALHRRIVNSATYRQDSVASKNLLTNDPKNEWLARGPVFRRSAEMIRDNAIFVSGLMSEKMGGAPVRAYDQEVSFKPAGRHKNTWRRSLYTYWRRNGPAPAMMALDAVKRDVCMVKRETTSSPLQSLVLLNGPQFVEAARVTAQNVLDQEDALATAFRMFTSRAPSEAELAVLERMREAQIEHFTEHPDDAKALIGVGDKPAPKDADPVQLAALAAVVGAIFNHDETLTRR